MLPGFRFLLAAIVLSVSIVTFGLGAAALLRAAHEEFASIPARRLAPEPYFAQPAEPPAEPAKPEVAAGEPPAIAPSAAETKIETKVAAVDANPALAVEATSSVEAT